MSARLLTIPISHFCEKARWALDRAGIEYREERHLQFFHIAAARRAGGGQTVPVLVADGTVLGESADIVRWADAGLCDPEAEEIEAWLDGGLGPDGRLWMYHHTLPELQRMQPWATAGVPEWERLAFRAALPLVAPAMRKYLNVSGDAAAEALTRVDAVFDEIAARLSDGRRYLLGDRFTAADLTFAALAAAVLLPVRYGSPLPPVEALPEPMAREVRRLRAHPAGRFADRLYSEERASSWTRSVSAAL